MSQKKRIVIFTIAILLMAAGFVCIGIAAAIQDTNREYANIIGFSSFGMLGLAVLVLLKNCQNIVLSELTDMETKIRNEADFFSVIKMPETHQTLEDHFIKMGFQLRQEYLHKWQFSFAKDYINYYVVIAQEENIIEYFEAFLKKAQALFQAQTRLHKNNVVYVFFFNRTVCEEELMFLKTIIINQEVMQGLPGNFDTVLPILYDTTNQQYMIRTPRRRFSIALLDVALRKCYKILHSSKA